MFYRVVTCLHLFERIPLSEFFRSLCLIKKAPLEFLKALYQPIIIKSIICAINQSI